MSRNAYVVHMEWFIALMGFVGGLGAAGTTSYVSTRDNRQRWTRTSVHAGTQRC